VHSEEEGFLASLSDGEKTFFICRLDEKNKPCGKAPEHEMIMRRGFGKSGQKCFA